MEAKKINSISIIGAGNVASHIASRFFKNGIQIVEVWSKHAENAEALAEKVGAKVCVNLAQLGTQADLIVISVKDDALQYVLTELPAGVKAIVHTSGSIDLKLLQGASPQIGVLYPLQSFNKNEAVDWANIPVCVEANGDAFTESLFQLGQQLSTQVQYVNSTQRIQLHIAAIFANNFTNYLYSISHELLVRQHLPFSILLPLIQQTVNRLNNHDPFLLQTGPAKRNDVELIDKHTELLAQKPDIQEVYTFLSDKIIKKTGN